MPASGSWSNFPNKHLPIQSGGGGSSRLSDITSPIPTAASAIQSTAAQMPSALDKGPINKSISMASANTALPIQKLRLCLALFK